MTLRDAGYKGIAKTLNGEGIRTGDGQRLGRATEHEVLTNEEP